MASEVRPNVRLDLAGTAENIVLVREVLSGVAQAIDLDGSELNDIRTAVTEACSNVVQHAYGSNQGRLEVEVLIAPHALEVVVRDRGSGFRAPTEDIDETTRGIGLHVIETLAQRVEIRAPAQGGTEVRMEFDASWTNPLDAGPDGEDDPPTLALTGAPAATTVSIAPIGLARTVLPRLISALAARAHFSIDRISDTQLLADALIAHAPRAISGNHLDVGINVEPRDLELLIAPLGVGRAEQLIRDSELDSLGKIIEKLTDRRRVATAGAYETLTLGLIERR